MRQLNSIENRRLCSNNICISIAAMDAILWHVALNKECEYLLGSALDDKVDLENQIVTLDEKIGAIQPRLDDIDKKRERIVDAYIEGSITKESKQKKFEELEEQRLQILRQKLEYEQKKDYARTRIEDIMKLYALDADDANKVSTNMGNVMNIKEKLEKNADDEEKFRLVHRHIQQVKVEKTTITYRFNEKKIRPANAKFVTIILFDETEQYYYFLSTDGKGGHWIYSDKDGNVYDDVALSIEHPIVCKTRLRQRAKHKELKKQAFESKYSPDRLYLKGYQEMSDYLCMNLKSTRRRCVSGFFEDALSQYDKKTHILDAERALEIMRASEDVWIKKAVKRFDAHHGKEDSK